MIIELAKNKLLFNQVKRIAYFESEIDLGVNPICNAQAKTSILNEADFDYIGRVSRMVESRLSDSVWLNKTISYLNKNRNPFKGIRFDDELFKPGRGILKSYLEEKN